MSDFDKEAERERLREKYERDKQKRETTEKMSELLLQGATMTNAHCSDCNDPIFRYDGQEFCASCEKPVDRDTGEDGDEQENGQSAGAIEITSPSDDARVAFGGVDEQADQPREQATQDQPREQQAANREQPSQEQPTQREHEQPTQRGREQQRAEADAPRETEGRQPPQETPGQQASQPTRQPRTGGTPAGDADIGAVRDSLVRTLRRFSEQAEACEDPQRAREHLAAAREAAETLEALRR